MQISNEDKKWVDLILEKGICWKPEGWIHPGKPPSIQILTDTFLRYWSMKEGRCNIFRRRYSHLNLWTKAVHSGDILVSLPITVIALKCVKQVECLEPLKNQLAALCRAIRNKSQNTGRIFITNNIPNPRMAPVLGIRMQEHNKLLFLAIAGINPKTTGGRVFYCDMEQHFVSGQQHLEPIKAHFDNEGNLTATGCFIYRSCLFREIGVVPYPLDPRVFRFQELLE